MPNDGNGEANSTTTVAIVGGGYTGAISAILLSRMSSTPLDIRIIEPRQEVGRGLAYDTEDPAHRLNVPPALMVLYLDDIEHFSRFVSSRDIAGADPGAVAADGSLYVRRSIFGDYMAGEVRRHRADNPSGSRLRHYRDRAVSMEATGQGYRLALAGGGQVDADAVMLCTSHGTPSLPPGIPDALRDHIGMIADPWSKSELSRIGADDRLLVVGAGLTGADVVVSLRHRGHKGKILMLSRHGLPPNRQHDFGDVGALLDRVRRPVPILIERHGHFTSVRQVLHAVRRDVAKARREVHGADWRDSFDHVRDAAGVIWRNLPMAEKRRYSRHLASYYGSHRNRVAPQVIDQLEELQRTGQLSMQAGRIESAYADSRGLSVEYRKRRDPGTYTGRFDFIVNCTGPVHRPDAAGNSFLGDTVAKGFTRPDVFGLGMDVDEFGRAKSADGGLSNGLYVAGPLSRGYFGDIIGVPQITAQLHTILPTLLPDLTSPANARQPD